MKIPFISKIVKFIGLSVIILPFLSCERLQMMGKEYREKLTFLVEHARDDQEEAKKQFRSALEEFSSLINFEGGDLQDKYEELNKQYERSKSQAQQVKGRIAAIESVAKKLFREWEKELELYESDNLRSSSEKKLDATKVSYEKFIDSMKRAEGKMDPILSRFNDQVLFLKHNLNASAIASLEKTVIELESDVTQLVEDLEKSIAEANALIEAMGIE